MDWISVKEAKVAAKKGAKAALTCSIEHWWQLSHRPKSVFKAWRQGKTCILSISCALCYKYKPKFVCIGCPAGKDDATCCDGLWRNVKDAECNIIANTDGFTKAAKKVYEFLKGLEK